MGQPQFESPTTPTQQSFGPYHEMFDGLTAQGKDIASIKSVISGMEKEYLKVDALCKAFSLLYYFRVVSIVAFPLIIATGFTVFLVVSGSELSWVKNFASYFTAFGCIVFIYDLITSSKKISGFDQKITAIEATNKELEQKMKNIDKAQAEMRNELADAIAVLNRRAKKK